MERRDLAPQAVNRIRVKARALGHASLYVLLTVLGMLVQGYHPGLEDDSFYLAAIRKDLNPSLFPRDAEFFQLQFQATIFDRLIAWSVRLTHLPLEWVVLAWQFATILAILWACGRIAAACFPESHARWAAVGLIAALLTLPIAGTGLLLVDQYLHPRAVATALILWAIVAVLERRQTIAVPLLASAAFIHIIMAAFGCSCCLLLARRRFPAVFTERRSIGMAAMALPLGWVFDGASPAWKQAASTRAFYFLSRWEWYEWLGVGAPMLLLWWFYRVARSNGSVQMARVASRLLYFGAIQMTLALAIMLPPRLERMRPFEPMRFLHLLYLLFLLLAGGLIGKYVLLRQPWRWTLFFVPLCGGMLFAQCQMYPSTKHLEVPGMDSHNHWVNAFLWIRGNTPPDSLFALGPRYMELPGEDFHGFRAISARSCLADGLKDAGMVARVPRLAGRWLAESDAQSHWQAFRAPDFQKLKRQFGVNWVVLAKPEVAGLTCPWEDAQVAVCRLP